MNYRSSAALALLLGLLPPVQSAPPTAVTMILQWEHQAQFAGYYMAKEKGFYADENLEVSLQPGGADINPLQEVLSDNAQFCSAMLSSALTQSEPHRLTLLTQLINRSNLAVVAWRNGANGQSLIEKPSDLTGKISMVWDRFRTPYHQFFTIHNAEPVLIPQYYTFSLFLYKGCDSCCAMLYNEYHTIQQLGIPAEDLTVFDLHKMGINLPEDGTYCRRAFYQAHPEVCTAFSRANLRGWDYAKEHPEETLDIVMRYVHEARLPTNRPHMRWMLNTLLPSIYPKKWDLWETGKLSPAAYTAALTFFNIKDSAPAFADFVSKEASYVED